MAKFPYRAEKPLRRRSPDDMAEPWHYGVKLTRWRSLWIDGKSLNFPSAWLELGIRVCDEMQKENGSVYA